MTSMKLCSWQLAHSVDVVTQYNIILFVLLGYFFKLVSSVVHLIGRYMYMVSSVGAGSVNDSKTMAVSSISILALGVYVWLWEGMLYRLCTFGPLCSVW